MRIVGIDPGSGATGYGLVQVEGGTLVRIDGGVIRVGDRPIAQRLAEIHARISEVILRGQPDAIAIESVFTARNPRSALLLGQARGAALAACGQSGFGPAEYAPSQVKVAVAGYGAAGKAQVQRMVQRILSLAAERPSDEADALAVAICHAHSSRLERIVEREARP